jgi:hypothetical protein
MSVKAQYWEIPAKNASPSHKIDRASGDVLALVEKSLQIFYPPRHAGYGWWRANLFSLATMRI